LIFTDQERLPAILQAAKETNIPIESVFIVDNGKTGSHRRDVKPLSSLLNYGELEWERINDLKRVSERFEHRSYVIIPEIKC